MVILLLKQDKNEYRSEKTFLAGERHIVIINQLEARAYSYDNEIP